MQKVDAVIAVLAAVAVLGSAVGVATYEESGTIGFDIVYATSTERLAAVRGSAPLNGKADLKVEVPFENVTEASFAVEVRSSGTHTQADEITVTVRGPSGQTGEGTGSIPVGSGGSSTITLRVAVGTVPGTRHVEAGTPDDALAQATERDATRNGTGPWTVSVEVRGGALPLHTAAHDTSVVPTITRFTGSVSVHTPEGGNR